MTRDNDDICGDYEEVSSAPRRRGLTTCFDCGSEVSTSAVACPKCGRPMKEAARPEPTPLVVYREPAAPIYVRDATGARPSNVNVYVPPQEESVTFAVVTLLFWIFLAPVGLLLNLVGLLTGPKRGCFFSMFFLFVLLPVGVVLLLVMGGLSLGIPFLDDALKDLRPNTQYSDANAPTRKDTDNQHLPRWGSIRQSAQWKCTASAQDIACFTDGRRILVSFGSHASVFDARSGSELAIIHVTGIERGPIRCLAVAPNDRFFAVGTDGGVLAIYACDPYALIGDAILSDAEGERFPKEWRGIYDIAVSRDSGSVGALSGCRAHIFHLSSAVFSDRRNPFEAGNSLRVSFSRTGASKLAFAGSGNSLVLAYNIFTGTPRVTYREYQELTIHDPSTTAVTSTLRRSAFSTSSGQMFVPPITKVGVLGDGLTIRIIYNAIADNRVYCGWEDFRPGAGRIAGGSLENTRTTSHGNMRSEIGTGWDLTGALLVNASSTRVNVIDSSGRVLQQLYDSGMDDGKQVASAAISPDGGRVIVAFTDGTIRVWG